MTTKSFIIAILFSFSTFAMPAVAANLTITVFEKGSGDPIEGATVVLGETGDYDVTEKNGSVIFEDVEFVPKIKILNAGHETVEESLKDTLKKEWPSGTDELSLTFYLYPLSIEGEALEVVEDRLQEKTSKITLSTEELRRIPGTSGDPLKVLSSMPGIVVSQGQGGVGQIYIRGSGGEDNGILVNRIPIQYLYHFGDMSGVAPSTINPSLIKDFNAFLGGFPVEYEDKLGGILDVQLRKPKNDRLHQNYRLAIHESAFLIEGPVQEENDNDSFYVAGRVSYLDKILTPDLINKILNGNKKKEDSDINIISLPRYYDGQANWHRELKKGYLDVYYFMAGDSLSINLINATKKTDPALIGELSIDLDYASLGTNWLHRYSNKLTQIATFTLRQFNSKQRVGTDPLTKKSFFVDVKDTTATFDPQLIWRVKPKHVLTLGTSVSAIKTPVALNIAGRSTEDNPNSNFTTAEKFQTDLTLNAGVFTPYVKHRWEINSKLTSILGLRYSYIKATGGIEFSGFSPRAAFEYQYNKQLLLNASWGKYLQTPAGATILTGVGNPQMDYTEAEHRILGLEYQLNPLWTMKLETYQKPMEKLVLFIPNQSPPNNYKNSGTGEAYGIDLLIKRKVANRTLGWLSYSYGRSKRTTVLGKNRNFTGDQPHTLALVWSQPMNGSWKRWTWGIKMALRSGSTYTPILGRTAYCQTAGVFGECSDQTNAESDAGFSHWQPITPEKRNSKRLPFDSLMSIRFDRDIRFNTWKLNVFFDIQNIRFKKQIKGYNYGNAYEDANNPTPITAFSYPIPLFGLEADL